MDFPIFRPSRSRDAQPARAGHHGERDARELSLGERIKVVCKLSRTNREPSFGEPESIEHADHALNAARKIVPSLVLAAPLFVDAMEAHSPFAVGILGAAGLAASAPAAVLAIAAGYRTIDMQEAYSKAAAERSFAVGHPEQVYEANLPPARKSLLKAAASGLGAATSAWVAYKTGTNPGELAQLWHTSGLESGALDVAEIGVAAAGVHSGFLLAVRSAHELSRAQGARVKNMFLAKFGAAIIAEDRALGIPPADGNLP